MQRTITIFVHTFGEVRNNGGKFEIVTHGVIESMEKIGSRNAAKVAKEKGYPAGSKVVCIEERKELRIMDDDFFLANSRVATAEEAANEAE